MRGFFKKGLALLLCMTVLAGCASQSTSSTDDSKPQKKPDKTSNVAVLERPSFWKLSAYAEELETTSKSKVPAYSVDRSFSNVINSELLDFRSEEFKDKLQKNLFVVGDEAGPEFFGLYERNCYNQIPNFVTVDSLMHTYHLFFAYLLKNTEKEKLFSRICTLTDSMLKTTLAQYDDYKETEWEEASKKNVEFFTVAALLCGRDVEIADYAKAAVEYEMANINAAAAIAPSEITGIYEDYSQYKVRGYYEGDETLERYFKTMMWYGRMTFPTNDELMNRAAMLISLALNEAGTDDWEAVYAVTSFFAGNSDDCGYCEYLPLVAQAYDGNFKKENIAGNDKAFEKYVELLEKLTPPKVNAVPVEMDEDNSVKGFRFMGQRFTMDAYVMQNLIYRAVSMNSAGEARMLPSVLDFPAALGSDVALEITHSEGADRFADYSKNMNKLRDTISNAPEETWNASLYTRWIDTLRPLLDTKGEGYPSFMTSKEWTKKNLSTFAGSYTELKHDTVLYGKPSMAEMGGGDEEEIDDRGYVEPEPLVYSRFVTLADATLTGLKHYKLLDKKYETELKRLVEVANRLKTISEKELANELCTDEEYDFIRDYGGHLEHFWYEIMRDDYGEEYFDEEQHPAALVVDIATDPNGLILEAGNGNPRRISVIVPVDGTLRIAEGTVYNFYEFSWPLSERLTDTEWGYMIGAIPGIDEEGYYVDKRDYSIKNPSWTNSYSAKTWGN